MKRPKVSFDKKQFRIGSFAERISLGFVGFVDFNFNEVHGVTRYGTNNNFGDYHWYLIYI